MRAMTPSLHWRIGRRGLLVTFTGPSAPAPPPPCQAGAAAMTTRRWATCSQLATGAAAPPAHVRRGQAPLAALSVPPRAVRAAVALLSAMKSWLGSGCRAASLASLIAIMAGSNRKADSGGAVELGRACAWATATTSRTTRSSDR
jgi:hypothetical protein